MKRLQLVAAAFLVVGLVAIIVAPQARSCMSSGDATICETIGVIGLNVIGAVLLAVGVLGFVVSKVRSSAT